MRFLHWFAFALLVLLSAGPALADTVTFKIYDELSATETEEQVVISVNHEVVATVDLGPQKATETLILTVPAALSYRYDLCGHLKKKQADGSIVSVPIDNGGILDRLADRELGVFGSHDIVFFLRDMTLVSMADFPRAISAKKSCPGTVG